MTDRFVVLLTLIINISNELYNFTYFINLPFIDYDYYKIILRKSVIISYRCLLVVAQLHSQHIRFSPKLGLTNLGLLSVTGNHNLVFSAPRYKTLRI